MSADILYGGNTAELALTADGRIPATSITTSSGCCEDALCFTAGEAACAVFDLLPSGPMWDAARMQAREEIAANGGSIPLTGFSKTTLFSYAAFVAQMLEYITDAAIRPVVRESDPETATDLDYWLDRLGWVDCYRTNCRSEYLAMFSPYEDVDATCGGTKYCAYDFPADFEAALKYGIVRSLLRMNMGVIRSLSGINWVIAPLGAVVRTPTPLPPTVQNYMDNFHNYDPKTYTPDSLGDCGDCFGAEVQLEITSSSATLPGAPTAASFCDLTSRPADVAALQAYDCNGTITNLYPGVIAAECIVRSMLPQQCPNLISRV